MSKTIKRNGRDFGRGRPDHQGGRSCRRQESLVLRGVVTLLAALGTAGLDTVTAVTETMGR